MKKIVLWVVSVFLVLMSLVPFSGGGILSGLLVLASGIICNPKFLEFLEKKIHLYLRETPKKKRKKT